jgi:hypothetical protein
VAVRDRAAAPDDDVGMGLEQADQLVTGRHRFAGQHSTLTVCDDLLDQRLIVADLGLPEFDHRIGRHAQLRRRLPQIGQSRAGDFDQRAIQLHASGSTSGEWDGAVALLRRPPVIAP